MTTPETPRVPGSVVRPLALEDIEPLAAGGAELPLMRRYGRTAEKLAADLRGALGRGDALLAHAPDAAAVADGFAWFYPTGTFALGGYLRLILVTPAALGRGAGARLLAGFEAAVTRESRHAFLLVSDFNTDAQRFYARRGYSQVGALPGLVLPDVAELVFHKRLR